MSAGPGMDDLIVVGAGVFGAQHGTRGDPTRVRTCRRRSGPISPTRGGLDRAVAQAPLDLSRPGLFQPGHRGDDRVGRARARHRTRSCFERLGNLVYTVNDEHPTLDAFQAASERAGGTIERLGRGRAAAPLPARSGAPAQANFEADGGVAPGDGGDRRDRDAWPSAAGVADRPRRTPVVRLDLDGTAAGSRPGRRRRLTAPRIVVAAGAWTARLVPELRPAVTLKRQGLAYLPDLPGGVRRRRVSAVLRAGDRLLRLPADGRRPGQDRLASVRRGRPTTRTSIATRDAKPFLDGVVGASCASTSGWTSIRTRIVGASCLYDMTPTTDFIVDFVPGQLDRARRHRWLGPWLQVRLGDRAGRHGPRSTAPADRWLPAFAWSRAVAATRRSRTG